MLATIQKIDKVEAHPEADRLDVVSVLGFTCVVTKNKYKKGDVVVYIHPDTVLPDLEWACDFRKYAPNRVKATKLNSRFSVWSFGIIVNPDEYLKEFKLPLYKIGLEVSDIIGVTKYEAEEVRDFRAKGGLPYGLFPTDEENVGNLGSKVPYGVQCDVLRKFDGSSCTFYYNLKDKKFGVTSRKLDLKLPRELSKNEARAAKLIDFLRDKVKVVNKRFGLLFRFNKFLRDLKIILDLDVSTSKNEFIDAAEKYQIENKLKAYCEEHNLSLALRGEVYGKDINAHAANVDAKKPFGWVLFNVMDLNTNTYYDRNSEHYFLKVAEKLNIPNVDVFEQNVELTPELIEKYKNVEKFNNEPYEGVVIQVAKSEIPFGKYQKQSFKCLNYVYDAKKS
jgi:RNA ligase (TIGR02306 family)